MPSPDKRKAVPETPVKPPRPMDEWAGQINRAFGQMPYGGSAGYRYIEIKRPTEWNPDPPEATPETICEIVVWNLIRMQGVLDSVAKERENEQKELQQYRDILRSLKELAGLIVPPTAK